MILALPDDTRSLYLAVSSDRCEVYNILAKKDEKAGDEEIPRIAERSGVV